MKRNWLSLLLFSFLVISTSAFAQGVTENDGAQLEFKAGADQGSVHLEMGEAKDLSEAVQTAKSLAAISDDHHPILNIVQDEDHPFAIPAEIENKLEVRRISIPHQILISLKRLNPQVFRNEIWQRPNATPADRPKFRVAVGIALFKTSVVASFYLLDPTLSDAIKLSYIATTLLFASAHNVLYQTYFNFYNYGIPKDAVRLTRSQKTTRLLWSFGYDLLFYNTALWLAAGMRIDYSQVIGNALLGLVTVTLTNIKRDRFFTIRDRYYRTAYTLVTTPFYALIQAASNKNKFPKELTYQIEFYHHKIYQLNPTTFASLGLTAGLLYMMSKRQGDFTMKFLERVNDFMANPKLVISNMSKRIISKFKGGSGSECNVDLKAELPNDDGITEEAS